MVGENIEEIKNLSLLLKKLRTDSDFLIQAGHSLFLLSLVEWIQLGLLFPIQFGTCPASCGSCGYPLNLTSSARATSGIGSEYRKSIKKGFISFISIDLSRFTQVDEVNCLPISFGRYRSKTKLLCRKCGVQVGYVCGDSHALCGLDSPTSSASSSKTIMIKIRALQPSEDC